MQLQTIVIVSGLVEPHHCMHLRHIIISIIITKLGQYCIHSYVLELSVILKEIG